MLRDLRGSSVAGGVVGLVFSAIGHIAVILSAGTGGGLSSGQLASWVFGVFFLNGVLTAIASWVYRQPLAFFWTIPGTVMIGASLNHLRWAELGAFLVTALLIVAIGLTGWVRAVMAALPMPIVMAMVVGVFLSFGLDPVTATGSDAILAVPMIATFVLPSVLPRAGRAVPSILGALIAGALAVAVSGRFEPAGAGWLAQPMPQAPEFTWRAIAELVVPLAIHRARGPGRPGRRRPQTGGTGAHPRTWRHCCAGGTWSLPAAAVGAVSTSLTGPTNALLVASTERSRQYTAGIVCGLGAIVVGLLAPALVRFMLATPCSAAWRCCALRSAFVTAFRTNFTLDSLLAFLVTVSGVQPLNINAAFWGLLAGVLTSLALERADFAEHASPAR
ncbi:benzoate/H(+) symporter BenE family transporter [Saccharomonospora halophila]|uniref:benzoate/H(+) symporter BenE family transporter n=1 Tax=Saccharomonospora halophila TaxID=129922 RepID=UPI0018DDBA42|nr:benzoate/H(+) symporter BenE family transporter [Saccharomonospora halophila]